MKRVRVPHWITDLVSRIATDYNLPMPEIVMKQAPDWRYVYGFPKKGPDAGKRVKYLKQYGEGWYSAHATYPEERVPRGRVTIRVRDLGLEILPQIVLHEMAHLVAGPGTNHSVEFYWHVYRLVDRYGARFGVTVTDMALWEGGYKPRNSVDGLRAYRQTIGAVAA